MRHDRRLRLSALLIVLVNQRDKEKARRLLKEVGYQGQPVRWIVTTEYEHHYKPALVAKSQLEEVGFKIDLQVLDWATVVQRRNKPELWDAFSTAFVFEPEAHTNTIVICEWPGWWCNSEKDQLLQTIGRELDPKKRYAMWERERKSTRLNSSHIQKSRMPSSA